MTFDTTLIAWLVLMTAVAAFTQGFCGFGYGILSMALVSLVAAGMERVSVVITMGALVAITTIYLMTRRDNKTDWKQVGLLLVGSAVCVPFGYWFLAVFGDRAVFRLVLGVALLGFAVYGLARPHVKRKMPLWAAPLFGGFSGLLTGAFSTGGPPMVFYLYTQEDDPRLAKGTLQVVFTMTCLFRLTTVALAKPGLTAELFGAWVYIIPGTIVLTVLGHWMSKRLSIRVFRVVVYGVIALAGVMNVAKGLSGPPTRQVDPPVAQSASRRDSTRSAARWPMIS